MKILQVNNYGYIKGGSEKVFFESIKVLKQHSYQVRAFCMNSDDNIKSDEITSVSINKYEERRGLWETLISIKNFFYNKKVEKSFEKIIIDFMPDIIHIHIIYGRLTNAIIKVAEKYKIPIVQSVHEFRLLCPIYTCLNGERKICEKCATSTLNWECVKNRCSKGHLLNSILVAAECKYRDWFFNHQKKISGFIMVSKFIGQKHLEYYPYIKDKCYHIYNSVDTKAYSKFLSYDKYQQERYYLYFGRLSYEKGIMSLIDFFKEKPGLKLKIIGTGPLLTMIQQIVCEQSLSNIEILGYQSGDNLYNYVAKAYFTIVPSEWYENNPLTIIESLALGTPVIGNKIGGIPEIIKDSETGYIYDYNTIGDFSCCMEKANSLMKSDYEEMINSCIKEAFDKFNNDNYGERLISVYNSVINNYRLENIR